MNRVVETYLWMFVSLLPMIRPLTDFVAGDHPLFVVIINRLDYVSLFFFITAFPIVFRLVFGYLPLEALRRAQIERRHRASEIHPADDVKADTSLFVDRYRPTELAKLSSIELLALFSSGSKELSKNMYSRAGVYLIVGVFVAFSGLAFFYSQTASSSLYGQSWEALVMLAPKFGILLFIETIAFFFLRQYRAAMDEFRYYEAIKRNREETLALFVIASNGDKEVDVVELGKVLPFYSASGRLQKDQTTEILEGRKLEKNELEILEKIIDAVSVKNK